ncbi:hypothetical protein FA10DRAFT_267984 [Acaromyces ingoldii]|uniref:Uncharacterized protein n=1 Tax=Acaromyces ingoldii TaxID=215250 RepID=A0A316YNU5_9BASI|nr:hypothetical protein FA10DRAFT_267984 [Acaromyces ingoldii]PWN89415.1 hypothetical protein FA10DRAFT_267984 [Acaromyces ingoldii]
MKALRSLFHCCVGPVARGVLGLNGTHDDTGKAIAQEIDDTGVHQRPYIKRLLCSRSKLVNALLSESQHVIARV